MANGLPYGTVISYVGSADSLQSLQRMGWLPCFGQSLSNNDYPDLFQAIGTAFGGTGAPDFNLPDLRGTFLRGIDGGAGIDPDSANRFSQNPPNGNTGDMVGSRQYSQYQSHSHNYDHAFYSVSYNGSDISVFQTPDSSHLQNNTRQITNYDGGGAETRPYNVYVYYLIMAGVSQQK